jgi:hypothetical protein
MRPMRQDLTANKSVTSDNLNYTRKHQSSYVRLDRVPTRPVKPNSLTFPDFPDPATEFSSALKCNCRRPESGDQY